MRSIRRLNQFKKDLKRMEKRGKDFSEFKSILGKLASGQALEERHRDHPLKGSLRGKRDCHIEPDWVLIYELTLTQLILVRTGTHSDLFAN
jgi:mRNA interferase YafQ